MRGWCQTPLQKSGILHPHWPWLWTSRRWRLFDPHQAWAGFPELCLSASLPARWVPQYSCYTQSERKIDRHTYIHTFICIYILNMFIDTYIYTHMYIHLYVYILFFFFGLGSCVHTWPPSEQPSGHSLQFLLGCCRSSAEVKALQGLSDFLLIRQLFPVAKRLSSEFYISCEDAFDMEQKQSSLIIPLLPCVFSQRQNSKQPKGKSGPVSPLSLRGELNQELINAWILIKN